MTWISAFHQFKGLLYFKVIQRANRFINRLHHIPILGHLFPLSLLKAYHFKNFLFILSLIYRCLLGILVKLFRLVPLIFMLKVPEFISSQDLDVFVNLSSVNWIRIMYACFLWAIVKKAIVVLKRQKYPDELWDYLTFFQLNRESIWCNYVWMDWIKDLVFSLFPLWIVSQHSHAPLLAMLVLLGKFMAFVMSQWLWRRLYRQEFSFKLKLIYMLSVFLIAVGMTVSLNWVSKDFLTSTSFVLFLALIAILCGGWFLQKWRHFSYEIDYLTTMIERGYEMQIENEQAEEIIDKWEVYEAIELRDEMTIEKESSFKGLTGQAYLNAVLFSRYKKVMDKKVKHQIVVALILAAMTLIGFTVGRWLVQIPLENLKDILLMIEGLSFFGLYICSFGKLVVKVCFVNCDVSMMNYPFYREKRAILASFHYRFLRILRLNICLASVIWVTDLILRMVNQIADWQAFMVFSFFLILIMIFSSFQDLFLYYLFQPYTKNFKVDSFAFQFINALTFLLFLRSHRIYSEITNETMGKIGIGFVIYLMISYVLILLLSPKTFKMRDV